MCRGRCRRTQRPEDQLLFDNICGQLRLFQKLQLNDKLFLSKSFKKAKCRGGQPGIFLWPVPVVTQTILKAEIYELAETLYIRHQSLADRRA